MVELDNMEHETRLEEVHEAEVGIDGPGGFALIRSIGTDASIL